MNNSSLSSHGGAIGSYGTLSVDDSKFISNTAAINGGAIDMGGTVLVNASSFISNAAGFRGGGINTYGGTLTVAGSSFSRNYCRHVGRRPGERRQRHDGQPARPSRTTPAPTSAGGWKPRARAR